MPNKWIPCATVPMSSYGSNKTALRYVISLKYIYMEKAFSNFNQQNGILNITTLDPFINKMRKVRY